MTERGLGNEVQARAVAEQVAMAAVERFAQLHPAAEIPAPLKWAAAIAAAVMTAGAVALCFWMVTTLSSLQQTVTRIDERQRLTGDTTTQRLDKIEERLVRLEQGKERMQP